MTIKDCIDIVDNNKPNQYTIKDKVSWLSFIEEIIINDVLKTHEGYDGRYDTFTGYTEDKISVKLIVPSPYDRLYIEYLKMMIDKENGETARYNNSAASFNTYMSEYRKYYNKMHMPLSIKGNFNRIPPKMNTVGLSDAEYENLKRDIINSLSETINLMVSSDRLAEIVNQFAMNNIQMLKGKDGYTPKKGVDYFLHEDFKDIGLENKAHKDLSNVDDSVFKAKAKRAGVGEGIDCYTKVETQRLISTVIESMVMPTLREKANADLSNVLNEDMIKKLNSVLSDGDEVRY